MTAAKEKLYKDYYLKQIGGNLPRYRASTVQYGYGIGGVLSNVFRRFASPLIKDVIGNAGGTLIDGLVGGFLGAGRKRKALNSINVGMVQKRRKAQLGNGKKRKAGESYVNRDVLNKALQSMSSGPPGRRIRTKKGTKAPIISTDFNF